MTTSTPPDRAPTAPAAPSWAAARGLATGRGGGRAPEPRRRRWGLLADAALVALLGAAAVLLHALAHEAGRAFAAWSIGASVVGFDAWAAGRPTVRLAGDLSGGRGAWVAAAGTALPWLATVVAALLLRPRRRLARVAALLWASIVAASLLPWAVLPLLGARPPGDAVTLFLARSGAPPALVAPVAVAAGFVLVVVAARGTGGLHGAWHALRAVGGLGRRAWAWAVVASLVLAVVLANDAAGRLFGAPATVLPPAGFTVAAEVGLRAGIGDDQLLADFAPTAHVLEVWVAVEGVTAGPITVDVVAPGGARTPVLRLPVDGPVGRASVRGAPLPLPPGPWSVVASAPRGEGRLVVAWRER